MKRKLATASKALGLAALGILMASCGNFKSAGTHKMGVPGKQRPMADSVMPSQAN